jgi:predicted DNA-binding antitoxin AbrB/MazE fold protein
MTITFDATYENGVLKPKKPLTLAEGAQVRVTLHTAEEHDPLAEVIGIGASGRSDGAANHDYYIYGTRKQR